MAPVWRQFEKLIARIEKALAPSCAIVKSPDRIPDKVTGELREVDASIRYMIGTCPVLITIECRDRVAIEDVRWIEQLAEKQRSIGASITIAVSSSGFSEPAGLKAEAVGIQLRVLSEATAADFVRWLCLKESRQIIDEWTLTELGVEVYDAPDDAEFTSSSQELIRQNLARAAIFIRNVDQRPFHAEQFIIEWRKRNGTFFPTDLPLDGTKVPRNLHQPFDRGCFHVETTKGKFDVRVLHIGLQLTRQCLPLPVASLTEYADPNSVLVQTAEWNLLENFKLSFHREVASGETRVTMTREPE